MRKAKIDDVNCRCRECGAEWAAPWVSDCVNCGSSAVTCSAGRLPYQGMGWDTLKEREIDRER